MYGPGTSTALGGAAGVTISASNFNNITGSFNNFFVSHSNNFFINAIGFGHFHHHYPIPPVSGISEPSAQLPAGGVGTGVLAAANSPFTWANAGWMTMAAFVLVMAVVAIFTIIPRHRAATAMVNPPEAHQR